MNDDYYSFIAMELGCVTEDFEEESDCAHEVCKVLSIAEGKTPETNYRLYISNVAINYATMYNATALFSGAKFLQIECDCAGSKAEECEFNSENIQISPFFQLGERMFSSQGQGDEGQAWSNLQKEISFLRQEVFG